MVGEFPELQGIMGGYYAEHHGENKAVSTAPEHYRPQGPDDAIPQTATGLATALADKIDTLVGFLVWVVTDHVTLLPFGAQHWAFFVLWMKPHWHWICLRFAQAAALHGFAQADADLQHFMQDRLRVSLRDKGIAHDIVACAMSADNQLGLLWKMRLAACLQKHLLSLEGEQMLAGYRRFASLLLAEQKKAICQRAA